jgi:hypothetical protein
MSLIDELRQSRTGRTAVLHEFKTNFDPQAQRIHAFVEGYEDMIFYRSYIEAFVGPEYKVFTYRCGNKDAVYEVFSKICDANSKSRHTLFFVDKDLSDLMPEVWPHDECIHVTEVYSIENYFVSGSVFRRICLELLRVRKVAFNFEPLIRMFELQLDRFHDEVKTIMAWIICVRRAGLRPNVQNIELDSLIEITHECVIGALPARQRNLERMTGISSPRRTWRCVRRTIRELESRHPKHFVRGKFESWFMVVFLQRSIEIVSKLCREVGGSIGLGVNLNVANLIEALVGRLGMPESLYEFLRYHYPPQAELGLGYPGVEISGPK